MGLAANQARLLVLTARNSDLQYRAQCIANRKLLLAMQTEAIAMDYTEALSNRILRFTYGFDMNTGTPEIEELSVNSIYADNSHYIGTYRLVLPDGRIAVPDVSYLPEYIKSYREQIPTDPENASGFKAGQYNFVNNSPSTKVFSNEEKVNIMTGIMQSEAYTDARLVARYSQPVNNEGVIQEVNDYQTREDKYKELIAKGASGLTDADKAFLKSIFSNETGKLITYGQKLQNATGSEIDAATEVNTIFQKSNLEDADYTKLLNLLNNYVNKKDKSTNDNIFLSRYQLKTVTEDKDAPTYGEYIENAINIALKTPTTVEEEKRKAAAESVVINEFNTINGVDVFKELVLKHTAPEAEYAAMVVSENGTINIYEEYGNGKTEEYVVIPSLFNEQYFQNALRTGSIFIEKFSNADGEWQNHDWSGNSVVRDELYTEDDQIAEAEYATKTALLQNQDKMLDVELRQVETQQKACESELESVKKLLDKNIEKLKING